MKPLVSVLIPAFNAEPWIADTIKSALNQTWPRIEVIVINDGSRDQTLSIAQQFASDRLSIVSQENQGVCAARNRAFELCQGDYIQWLDADDLLAPDKIAKQMEVAEECQSKRTLFSSAWGYFIFRPHKAQFVPTPLWCDLTPLEWLQRRLGRNLHMNPATWLVSRELSEANGCWDTRLRGGGGDDGEYFCRAIVACDGIRFVPDAKVFYRITSSGLSNIGRSSKKIEGHFLAMQLQIAHLRSLDDSEKTRAVCVNYLRRALLKFYPERPDIVQQAQQLAIAMGGKLESPRLSWKYAWIQKLFGWKATKWARHYYNEFKSSLVRSWDKTLFRVEGVMAQGRTGHSRGKSAA